MSEDVPPPATKRPGRTPRLSDAECREIAAEFDGTTPPSTRCLCAGSCDTPACDATTSSRRRVAAATSLRRRAAAGRRARTTSCARTGSACPGPRSRPPSVAASLRSGCAGAVCSSAGTKATRARPAAVGGTAFWAPLDALPTPARAAGARSVGMATARATPPAILARGTSCVPRRVSVVSRGTTRRRGCVRAYRRKRTCGCRPSAGPRRRLEVPGPTRRLNPCLPMTRRGRSARGWTHCVTASTASARAGHSSR